jgi:alkylation response protein AidB-like acyl-CoA dehydrogenase
LKSAPQAPVRAATDVAAIARHFAAITERDRRLAKPVLDALVEAGLMRLLVPRELGGLEADVATMVESIEAVAQGDGAAGWCLMIAATTGVTAAQLPRSGAAEIYADPSVVTGGMLMPRGKAVRSDGGYRVSARWSYGSGSQHCHWMLGGSFVHGPEGPETLDGGAPHMRMFFFPAKDITIHDTWHVSGLRGTGSHDYEVTDVIVPEHHTAPIGGGAIWAPGTLYKFPVYGLLALGVAGVGLGIAHDAINELTELAKAKTPTGSRRPLADRAAAQSGIAEAEALRLSARRLLLDTVRETWDRVDAGSKMTVRDRAMLRLAATNAALACARAVDICYNLGGGSAIYEESRLQRHFRDIHTLTQHVMVGPATLEVVGRVMLDIPTDTSML